MTLFTEVQRPADVRLATEVADQAKGSIPDIDLHHVEVEMCLVKLEMVLFVYDQADRRQLKVE